MCYHFYNVEVGATLDQSEIKATLKAGIEAAKNNNPIIARDNFRRVLQADSRNELAWFWMAYISDDNTERRRYLERVLEINPDNQNARAALDKLVPASERAADSSMSRLRQMTADADETDDFDEGADQQRDWFQPVDRQKGPPELWRTARRRDDNTLMLLLMGAVAVMLIGLGIVLLLNYLEEEEEDESTPTTAVVDTNATQTALAVALQPTSTPSQTPRPTSILTLTYSADSRALPPTLPPSLTPTPLPTATSTPTPNPPLLYTLIFARNQGLVGEGEELIYDPADLFTVAGDGSDLQRLRITLPPLEIEDPAQAEEFANLPPEALEPNLLNPVYSPDGDFIVFTAEIGGIQELFVVAVDDNTPRQLTRLGASQTRDAVWSPDGETILFASNDDDDFELYLINADGTSSALPLTDNAVNDYHPDWSPDGNYIVFASDRSGPGNFEIYTMALQGEEFCQLTDSSGSSIEPDWSPDGKEIVFISNRNRDNDLFIMRADGTAEKLLTVSDGDWEERAPAWSPDGNWIVVSSNRIDPPSEVPVNATAKLWLITPDGEEWKAVTSDDGNDLDAAWLPTETIVDTSDFEYSCAIN